MGPEELMGHLDRCQKTAPRVNAVKAPAKKPCPRQMSAAEEEFIGTLKENLPPIISRKELSKYLGGAVSTSLLRHADAKGEGPAVAWKIGDHSVVYRTDSLLEWIVRRFGVKRLVNLNNL